MLVESTQLMVPAKAVICKSAKMGQYYWIVSDNLLIQSIESVVLISVPHTEYEQT